MSVLTPMSEKRYLSYLDTAVTRYASENVKAGRWVSEGAIERAKLEYKKRLPQGVNTENNHLFEINATERELCVGHIWIAIDKNQLDATAFIYDLEIYPKFRKKGYAKMALNAIESYVKENDVHYICLHVFHENVAAKALYAQSGYKVVSVNMAKSI